MNILIFILVIPILPIAIPGWMIEGLVRRIKPNWEFNQYTATPYFIIITILSVFWIISDIKSLFILGLIYSSSMFILCIALSIAISIGRASKLQDIIRKYGDRLRRKSEGTTFNTAGLYMGIISFLYAIFYFGLLNYSIYRFLPDSFSNVEISNQFNVLVDFVYYSMTTISSLGDTIRPISNLAKIISIIEIISGYGFIIFLFGAYVSYKINLLTKIEE